MDNNTIRLLKIVSDILPIITTTAIIVISILISVSKVKSTRNLGISMIFSGVSSLINAVSLVIRPTLQERQLAAMTRFTTPATILLMLGSILFFGLFIHKNYKVKYIYIPLFLIPLIRTILSLVLNKVFNSSETLFTNLLIQNIIGDILSAINFVIVIWIFYKNRKNEKVIPKYWKVRIYVVIWGAFFGLAGNAYYLSSAYTFGADPVTASNITLYMETHNITPLMLQLMITNALISLIVPIYVLKSVKKAERYIAPKEVAEDL